MGAVVATPGAVDGVRVERVVTSGTFSLDGGTWDVDNNVWLLGDDVECLVVDAAHDTEAILDAVAPGHAPGACCLYVPQLGIVLTGDTLFKGGPGATGRSYSSFDTIVRSIEQKLLTLPSETMVLTGHGDPTTIGDEAPQLQEWLDRGH